MKIAVLTQELGQNYGGILQAYALQAALRRMGHEVVTIDRRRDLSLRGGSKSAGGLIRGGLRTVWRFYKRYLRGLRVPVTQAQSDRETSVIFQANFNFLTKHVRLTPPFVSQQQMVALNDAGFDAFIVGSDQVWRPKYSRCLPNYFFDFVPAESGARRIAYAASFGVDDWEFSPEQTVEFGQLLKRFQGVSVREDSAVSLCAEHFNIDARQVLDPTMLLQPQDYIELVERSGEARSGGDLMVYLLDRTLAHPTLVAEIEQRCQLKAFSVLPSSRYPSSRPVTLDDCVYPGVEAWLCGLLDAEMVLTDSFHGCVFSILFNKSFWVIHNRGRGTARIDSLLRRFDCSSRLLDPADLEGVDLRQPLDFQQVNRALDREREASLTWLASMLQGRRRGCGFKNGEG